VGYLAKLVILFYNSAHHDNNEDHKSKVFYSTLVTKKTN